MRKISKNFSRFDLSTLDKLLWREKIKVTECRRIFLTKILRAKTNGRTRKIFFKIIFKKMATKAKGGKKKAGGTKKKAGTKKRK
ncbi:MAG: hypothetical protein MUD10_05550 [Candidatus Pacebacteria bacterium]|nr:hypothetical protein [Candidatus Paceibacterota bacterium]